MNLPPPTHTHLLRTAYLVMGVLAAVTGRDRCFSPPQEAWEDLVESEYKESPSFLLKLTWKVPRPGLENQAHLASPPVSLQISVAHCHLLPSTGIHICYPIDVA